MNKLRTLRNIIAFFSMIIFTSCHSNKENDYVNGQWQVKAVSSPTAFNTNMDDQNYSINVNQISQDGSTVNVSDENGGQDEAAVRFKSGNNMIVEYKDPQTGEKVLMQMKRSD
ncbi:MAG: hypothetical protein JWN78_2564 [Bacteroidota bacterium]|nr:hypothetical protein [Bacteroidota bacterium]